MKETLNYCALVYLCFIVINGHSQTVIKKKGQIMEYKSLSPNIGVKNVNETVKFYADILGFHQIMSVPESGDLVWAMVGSGNITIMFQEVQNLKNEYPELNEREKNSALTFYIKVKGMDVLYEKVRNTNYLVKEWHKTFYGTDEFAIRDNNGFILTITEDKE